MKSILLLAALIELGACNDSGEAARPAYLPPAESSTMPPNRVGACTDSALIDDKCTNEWYQCRDGRAECTRHWETCCNSANGTR